MNTNREKWIDRDTRIARIIAADPAAIEALIQLSPRFTKLRNPVLRKIMAGQTTVAMAARIGGISISQILGALSQLGLPVKKEADGEGGSQPSHVRPVSEVDFAAAFERIESKNLHFLDARPMIEK
ncbi:MAG: DUF1858 domain-containing protein, partial [Leptospiraceae bacterium]|nr:DUF1858 domain-containing protein [Leptospiraceae bacterium]